MTVQELYELAKEFKPSEEYLEGMRKRFEEFSKEYDRIADEHHLY